MILTKIQVNKDFYQSKYALLFEGDEIIERKFQRQTFQFNCAYLLG